MPTMRHRKGELGYDIVKRSRREPDEQVPRSAEEVPSDEYVRFACRSGVAGSGECRECDSE